MDKRFPIGTFTWSDSYSEDQIDNWLEDLALLPDRIREEIAGCSDDILLTPYREDGWNTRQIITHLLDSHTHAIIRVKLALTENHPTIMLYDQDKWVDVEDHFVIPLELSLDMLENSHEKLVRIYSSLEEYQWERTYEHPEAGTFTLAKSAAMYAWHSNHHLAHIRLVTGDMD